MPTLELLPLRIVIMPRPRLHKSSIAVGLLVAMLLVTVNIPGRAIDYQPFFAKTFEHGWPCIYLRRETREPTDWISCSSVVVYRRDIASYLPMWGIPWLSAENWRVWDAHIEEGSPRWDFREAVFLLNCAIATLVLIAVTVAWEFRRRRRPRLLCFGLSDMFVAVAVVSVPLGYLIHLNREYRRESQIDAEKLVSFDDTWSAYQDECIAPVWVRSLIGERFLPNFLWRHANVLIDPELVTDVDALTNDLSRLTYLRRIELMVGDGTPRTKRFKFSILRAVKQLETLDLCEYDNIDEQDVNELTQLTFLKKLVLWKDEVSPHLLSWLEAELPECNIVDFYDDW